MNKGLKLKHAGGNHSQGFQKRNTDLMNKGLKLSNPHMIIRGWAYIKETLT